jgi:hypothetical protein
MSLAEILEELPKLTEEERDELRSRLDEYDPEFLAVLQERVRGIESGERETIPVDQVIAEGRRLAQELAQQWAPNSTKKPSKNTSTQYGFTKRENHMAVQSKSVPSRALGVEILLRWSYYWVILGIVRNRRSTEPMTDKQLVLDTVHKLPDDTPLEKISEEIEFLVAVQQGLKALDEGRVVSHEDVKARVASWAHHGRK